VITPHLQLPEWDGVEELFERLEAVALEPSNGSVGTLKLVVCLSRIPLLLVEVE
jgi:hypothetical protein